MSYGKISSTTVAVAAALAAGPAIAQEREAFEDGYRFADVLQYLEDVAAMPLHERLKSLDLTRRWERRAFDMTDDEVNAFARWLGDAIVSDASLSDEARYLAARWLAGSAVSGEWNGRTWVFHPGYRDAIRTVFEKGEPTALCWRQPELGGTVPPDDLPHCNRDVRDPHQTPWCVAGKVLHTDEVNRAMGVKQVVLQDGRSHYVFGIDQGPIGGTPSEPPEVKGLSDGAALWWSRCWDSRSPGRPAW